MGKRSNKRDCLTSILSRRNPSVGSKKLSVDVSGPKSATSASSVVASDDNKVKVDSGVLGALHMGKYNLPSRLDNNLDKDHKPFGVLDDELRILWFLKNNGIYCIDV